MQPAPIQKSQLLNAVQNDSLVTKELAEQLSDLEPNSKIIEFRGIGQTAEYLYQKGHDVSLCDEDRLIFAFRKHVLPDSKVQCINYNPSILKLSKPKYDYVIINDLKDIESAKNFARRGIINNVTSTVEFFKKKEKNAGKNVQPDVSEQTVKPDIVVDQQQSKVVGNPENNE